MMRRNQRIRPYLQKSYNSELSLTSYKKHTAIIISATMGKGMQQTTVAPLVALEAFCQNVKRM
jgi:hypothetical protein